MDKYFIYAGIGVVIDFIFQITLFISIMTIYYNFISNDEGVIDDIINGINPIHSHQKATSTQLTRPKDHFQDH